MVVVERPLEGQVRTQHRHDETTENDRPPGLVHRPVLPLRRLYRRPAPAKSNNDAESGKAREQAKRPAGWAIARASCPRTSEMPDGEPAVMASSPSVSSDGYRARTGW